MVFDLSSVAVHSFSSTGIPQTAQPLRQEII